MIRFVNSPSGPYLDVSSGRSSPQLGARSLNATPRSSPKQPRRPRHPRAMSASPTPMRRAASPSPTPMRRAASPSPTPQRRVRASPMAQPMPMLTMGDDVDTRASPTPKRRVRASPMAQPMPMLTMGDGVDTRASPTPKRRAASPMFFIGSDPPDEMTAIPLPMGPIPLPMGSIPLPMGDDISPCLTPERTSSPMMSHMNRPMPMLALTQPSFEIASTTFDAQKEFDAMAELEAAKSESEVSGSGIVTPHGRRRNNQGIPNQHPHRNRRKVSAPPELQQHFGGAFLQGYHQGMHQQHNQGANPDHNTEYIINLSSNKAPGSEGLYSGSDSGVTSEYSSWAAPVSGGIRDVNYPDDAITLSGSGSIDDIDDHHPSAPHNENKFYQQSDSDCESLEDGIGGITNQAYLNSEPAPLVLSVNGPPPLNRIPTESSMASMGAPSPSMAGGPAPRQRTNSMVLQFNVPPNQQQGQMLPVSDLGNLQSGRSVSMVSLNALNVPQANLYPNLPSDTQSIYSEVNPYGPSLGYVGNQGLGGNLGSQANLPGMGLKMMDGQYNLGGNGGSGIMLANNHEGAHNAHGPMDPNEPDEATGSTEEKKKAWFKFTLSENLSTMYAVFLFCLGVVIYLADTFSGHDSAVAEGFNIYLMVVQLLWLFYVHIDVRKYINTISRTLDEARAKVGTNQEQVQLEPTGDGHFQLRINLPEPRKTIPQYYGFISGRHGGSLYLKIGATVFCFGSLIHEGLNLGQKILYMTESDPRFMNCTCTTDIVMSVLKPVYAFYQLFFIFKYSNLIINRRKILSRFGLMHCISSSLCFWFYAILQETLLALFSKKKKPGYGEENVTYAPAAAYGPSAYNAITGYDDDDDDSFEIDDDDDDDDSHKYTGTKIAKTSWSINYGCEKTTDLTKMINLTTPYLFPFTIEFNILIVGLWIILWENIGHTERHTHIPSVEVTYEEDNTKNFTSNLIIYVDCHSSNRGLFAGLLMTVATVVSIILFFIFTASDANVEFGRLVNGYSEIILLTAMGFTCLAAFNSIRKLDVNSQHISMVDDILLYICLPCIFLYAFLSMVPSLVNGETLFVMVSILQVTQVILQTALIADGLRRCSNTTALQHKKPGREVVTFLVVANVAMWLLETFEIKSESGNHQKYDYYGKELWTMLSHMTLPLALFYRFHSSVCLADMWKVSYEAEEAH